MNGKGHNQRPRLVSRETLDENWARTFGKKEQKVSLDDKIEPFEGHPDGADHTSEVTEASHTEHEPV